MEEMADLPFSWLFPLRQALTKVAPLRGSRARNLPVDVGARPTCNAELAQTGELSGDGGGRALGPYEGAVVAVYVGPLPLLVRASYGGNDFSYLAVRHMLG